MSMHDLPTPESPMINNLTNDSFWDIYLLFFSYLIYFGILANLYIFWVRELKGFISEEVDIAND
jgi:hypothetical protein